MSEDLDILARTLYGEARGEFGRQDGGLVALIAVANVVMNRVALHSWFGRSIGEVCLKPYQFSCWNKSDPNYALISEPMISHPIFETCRHVASCVATGQWPDITQGADHYHAATLSIPPSWAIERTAILRIGRHLFYRLSPRSQP